MAADAVMKGATSHTLAIAEHWRILPGPPPPGTQRTSHVSFRSLPQNVKFLGGDQEVGEDVLSENNVFELGALRNA